MVEETHPPAGVGFFYVSVRVKMATNYEETDREKNVVYDTQPH